ncbi:MAG: glycosyltransferase family 2 protein [Pseudomonadota bacterium]
MSFSLIIPLWNEGNNVAELVHAIAKSGLAENGMKELVLVNNGSGDNTGELVDTASSMYSWIVPVHLDVNHNYGGGVYEGFKRATTNVFCYIPGDLQVMPEDVVRVYKSFLESKEPYDKLFIKGNRTVRHDPLQTQVVSWVYTVLANLILRLKIKDVNGLPKMFHRSLMDLVPTQRMKTFVFDSQIISIARTNNWTIKEIPVTFHSRREGVSSWSSKRIQVYIQVFRQLLALRSLRRAEGVPLERLR